MSKPSFENIERWLFEYTEGNLNQSQIASLKNFLLVHPELDIDLDAWENAFIVADEVILPNPEQYKKPAAIRPLFAIISGAAALLTIALIAYNPSETSGGENKALLHSKHIISHSLANEVLQGQNYAKSYQDVDPLIYSFLDKTINPILPFGNSLGNANFSSNLYATNRSLALNNDQSINGQSSNNVEAFSNTRDQNRNNSNYIAANDSKLPKFETNFNYMEELVPASSKNIVLVSHHNSQPSKARYSMTRSGNNTESKNKSIFKPFFRKLVNVMDNPLALRNSRDAILQVPGLQNPQVNFGTAGTLLTTRVQSITRFQNYGKENEVFSEVLGVDAYSSAIRSGIGAQLSTNYYNNGAFKTYEMGFIYAPKFKINKRMTFEPGVRVKMGQKSIDPSKLEAGDFVEVNRGEVNQAFVNETEIASKKLWYKDLGLSAMLNSRYFFIGAQVDNIFNHDESIYSTNASTINRSDKHLILIAGTEYESQNQKFEVSPYLLYQKFGNLEETWLGSNFRYKWMNVGGAISDNFEPAASLGIKTKRFLLNYQADFTKSALMNTKLISHQLTLRILAKPNKYNRLNNY